LFDFGHGRVLFRAMNVGALRVLAVQEVDLAEGLRHVEIYTASGLVTFLWHGSSDAKNVVLLGGGALGGLLGPANGLYQYLGEALTDKDVTGDADVAAIRVGYRQPNDLGSCIGDFAAAGMLAERNGAEHFITLGHSFGGAVAIGAALDPSPIAESVVGVITLATQSAGCEDAAALFGRPLLMFHGDQDEILPMWASEVVKEIAGGYGDLRILPGAGHLLNENDAGETLRTVIPTWIRQTFSQARRH
jgi:pimeloyl-ACP methyl ester carboxylesterase